MSSITTPQSIDETTVPARTPRSLALLIWISLPVALVINISWLGVFTFVNGYIVKELHQSNATWTAATLWFSGGMAIWPFVCTEISAKIGRRYTVTLAMLVACTFYLVVPFVKNMAVIGFLLALMGFVQTANNVAWLPLVSHFGREFPGRALATNQFWASTVAVVSLVTGGYLIDNVSYRTGFWTFGLAAGICAVVFYRMSARLSDRESPPVVTFRAFSRQDLRDLGVLPFLVVIAGGISMGVFNYHTINQLFPNLARDVHHLSEKQIGLVVALGKVPALLSMLWLVRRVDHLKIYRTYGLGIASAAAMVAVLGLVPGAALAVAGYFGFYVFHGGVWATEVATVNASVVSRLRDTAFAVMTIMGTLAMFGVGLVHNRMLAAGFSLRQVFLVSGALGLVGGVILVAYSVVRYSRR